MKDRIKKIRKEFDLTQQKFAEKIGVKQNTVAQYEMGRNIPIDTVISLICKEFNVNEEWLRNGTGTMYVEPDAEDQLMEWTGKVLKKQSNSFQKRFVKMLMTLSEKEWEFLEKKAKELANYEENIDSITESKKTVEEFEEEYIKSRSNSVQKIMSSALNITESENKENKQNIR